MSKDLNNMISLISKSIKKDIKNAEINIIKNEEDKFGGFIVSESFIGMPQIDRQNLLWDSLDKNLSKKHSNKIIALLTVAPGEVSD